METWKDSKEDKRVKREISVERPNGSYLYVSLRYWTILLVWDKRAIPLIGIGTALTFPLERRRTSLQMVIPYYLSTVDVQLARSLHSRRWWGHQSVFYRWIWDSILGMEPWPLLGSTKLSKRHVNLIQAFWLIWNSGVTFRTVKCYLKRLLCLWMVKRHIN